MSGWPGITGFRTCWGNRFRRVTLTDPNRFGLLGQASILTLTSTANPHLAGAARQVGDGSAAGHASAAPPPNVPALKENAGPATAKPLSVRERMEEHRTNPTCAACHKLMDPIGFALENFDAVGVWRTNDSGFRIDPAGKLFDGAKLDGPASLRQAIVNHSDAFLANLHEKSAGLRVGRVIDYRDMPAVRAIDARGGANDNRFSAFVLGIVKSTPFQMRRAEETESAATDDVVREPVGDLRRAMFITKKHLSRRTRSPRHGRDHGAAAARFDGARADAAARKPRRSRQDAPGVHRDGARRGRQHRRRHRTSITGRRKR